MSVLEVQNHVVELFNQYSDWEDRYKKMIELGKELPELSAEQKTDKNLVKGCQSKVWLVAQLKDGKVELRADSDAMIVRGLVAILLQVYSGVTPADILATKPDFIEKLGFKNNLSASRTNGLHSMIKQIQYYALAFQAMSQSMKNKIQD